MREKKLIRGVREEKRKRKIIEDYLHNSNKEIDSYEAFTKFGIEIELVRKIFSDLLNEGIAE